MDGIEIAFKPCTMHHALLLRLSLSLSLVRVILIHKTYVIIMYTHACSICHSDAQNGKHTLPFIHLFIYFRNAKIQRQTGSGGSLIILYANIPVMSVVQRWFGHVAWLHQPYALECAQIHWYLYTYILIDFVAPTARPPSLHLSSLLCLVEGMSILNCTLTNTHTHKICFDVAGNQFNQFKHHSHQCGVHMPPLVHAPCFNQ